MWLIPLLMVLFACSGPSEGPTLEEVTTTPVLEATKENSATHKLTQINEAALAELIVEPSDRMRVLSFWATWCSPCVVEVTMLDALAHVREDVEFVLINIDHPSVTQNRVIPFIKKNQLSKATLYQLNDPDPNLALSRVVPDWPDSIPVTLIQDKKGITRERFDSNVHREQLEAALGRASHY